MLQHTSELHPEQMIKKLDIYFKIVLFTRISAYIYFCVGTCKLLAIKLNKIKLRFICPSVYGACCIAVKDARLQIVRLLGVYRQIGITIVCLSFKLFTDIFDPYGVD